MNGKTNEGMKQGFARGAAAAEAIVRDISGQARDNDFVFAYLANQIAGVLGYAAARLGHENARTLLQSVNATFDTGVKIVESGASSRVQ